MGFHFQNDTPIYLQIIEHIKQRIISKEYLPDQKIPSVRELSLQFEVNPNTVQKALAELENSGLIYTERTNGKFVTGNKEIIEQITKETVERKTNEFFLSMEKLGFTKKQILEILNSKE